MNTKQQLNSTEATFLSKQISELRSELEQVKSAAYSAKEVLTLNEAAMLLGVSKSTLYKMTHRQEIPYYRPNNKMVYFERSELLKWLRRGAVASQEQIDAEARAILNRKALEV